MKRIFSLVAVLLFAGSLVYAQEPTPVSELDVAWQKYVEARQSSDVGVRIAAAKDVLDIAERVMPPTDERLPVLMSNYGQELLEGTQTEAAQEVLERSVEVAKEIHGKDSIKIVPMLLIYADSRAMSGSAVNQLKYYKQALKIAKKEYGDDSTDYAEIAYRAGVKSLELSSSVSGKKYLQEARDIYLAELGEDGRAAGLAAFYLGRMEFTAGNYPETTEHLLDALKGFQSDNANDARNRFVARAILVQAYEIQGLSDLATEHCLAIGADSTLNPDQGYEPLFRMPAEYPQDLRSDGIEGHVILEFTVDEAGFVRNPVAIEREGDESFETAALAVIGQYRYAPQFEDGHPIAVDKVKTRISFEIAN